MLNTIMKTEHVVFEFFNIVIQQVKIIKLQFEYNKYAENYYYKSMNEFGKGNSKGCII